ncbi:MAG: substrate-binding domain-containing protein [Acidimicrobiia bacterium]
MRRNGARWRLLVATGALGLMLAGVVSVPVTSAPAAGSSAVTANPSSGLLDGQFVGVSWSGFTPGTPQTQQGVAVSQCSANPVLPAKDCALSELGITGSDGTGYLPIPVHTGAVQSRNGATTFTCDEHHPCTVAVYADPSKSLQSGSPAAVLPITFGFPASACPHGGTGVSGSGGEAAFRAMLRWEAVVCQPPSSLDLQYTRTESKDGKDALIGDGNGSRPDFAATSVPLTADEHAKLTAANRNVVTAPVAASALVFVFHGTDRVTGQRITNVTLTPSQLAHIFNGRRNSLPVDHTGNPEDDDIVDLNPGVHFKGSLQAFGRLDAAAGSLELTSWMLAAAPAAWKDVPSWVGNRPSADGRSKETVDYQTPTDRMPDGLQGPGAVGQLVNGPDNLGLLLAGKGSLGEPPDLNLMGYLDSTTARFYGLPAVCLQLDPNWRTTHTPCVAATPENIGKGLAAAKRNGDGTVTPDLTASATAGLGAYPIVDVSYVVADTAQATPAKAATLRSLLTYAVGAGQKPDVLPPGYAPLPADLVAVTTTAAAAITAAPVVPSATQGLLSGGVGGVLDPGGAFGLDRVVAALGMGTEHPAVKQRKAKIQDVSAIHYPKAGDALSGRASWWVVFALTALCLAGLLAHPAVRSRFRSPRGRGGSPTGGAEPPPTAVTS